MKWKIGISDKSTGWNSILRDLERINTYSSEAGIFAGDGRLLVQSDGEKKKINLAKLAAIHEFGTSYIHRGGAFTKILPNGEVFTFYIKSGTRITIPQRSFIRSALIEKEADLLKSSSDLVSQMYAGKINAKEVAQQVANKMRDIIKGKMRNGRFEPLSELTIKLKGSNKPLIDSWRLYKTIKARVGKR